MNALEILKEVAKTLKAGGIEFAEKEAEILIRHGLHMDTVTIYRDNPELEEDQRTAIEEMINRRLRHEPLQYILRYIEFLGLKLIVGPGVLIPRPETELMAEYAIKTVMSWELRVKIKTPNSELYILDLCTGSGCLALALAKEFPQANVYGTDISEVAVGYAKENARINGIGNVTFLRGSLFEPIEKLSTVNCQLSTFDLIIANPPYVKAEDIRSLQPEVRDWEPIEALNGGEDGLNIYRELIPSARRFLKDHGILILEVGSGQSDDIAHLLQSSGYADVEIIKDYAGIDRIIQARKR